MSHESCNWSHLEVHPSHKEWRTTDLYLSIYRSIYLSIYLSIQTNPIQSNPIQSNLIQTMYLSMSVYIICTYVHEYIITYILIGVWSLSIIICYIHMHMYIYIYVYIYMYIYIYIINYVCITYRLLCIYTVYTCMNVLCTY